MGRRRRPSPFSGRRRPGRIAGSLVETFWRHGGSLLRFTAAVLLVAAMVAGLGVLQGRVRALPEYDLPITVVLLDRPSWLDQAQVDEILAGLPELRFLDDETARMVADHVGRSGWVARVDRVEKCRGGRVEVRCRFRQPLAVVQQRSGFRLVDDRGVLLPGVYSEAGNFLIIQGVGQPAPEAGRTWEAADLSAGLRLAKLIQAEPFAGQVGAISVHNYGGRESAGEAHLALLTRPDSYHAGWGRVLWGSGPGEEIEEPTAEEKIRLLRTNFQRCGRIDAGAPWIDVSISPGEYRKLADEQSV